MKLTRQKEYVFREESNPGPLVQHITLSDQDGFNKWFYGITKLIS